MAVERTHALICFNDSHNYPADKGRTFVHKLADDLQRNKKIDADIKGYKESTLDPNTHQWLIFILSPEATASPTMQIVVNHALDEVVQRRMRGVLAVTLTPYDPPSRWASIRTYDVSKPDTENEVLARIRRDMGYVKLPYTQALSQSTTPSPLPNKLLSRNLLVIVALVALLIIFGLGTLGATTYYNNIANATATTITSQAIQIATHQQATATAVSQTLYDQFFAHPKSTPKITGFKGTDQWGALNPTDGTPPTDPPPSCKAGNHNTYSASVTAVNQYMPCIAAKPSFTNFAMQVNMQINGDAGGVIFRSNNTGTYYRVAVNQSDPTTPTYDLLSVFVCNNDCTQTNVAMGTQLLNPPSPVPVKDRTKPITLSLLVRNNDIAIFVNKSFITHVSDEAALSPQGNIGVYAASLATPTTVTFSDLTVWQLDTKASTSNLPPPVPAP